MGKFQAMNKYFAASLVLILACNGSLLTYGRKIKPSNQNSSLNTRTHPTLPFHGPSSVDFPPTSTLTKNTESSMTQNYDAKTSFDDSGAHNSNAFRPTTPGGSPGVGHPKFAAEDIVKDLVAVKSNDVKVSVSNDASTNDFRPTDPGNSPGVGHAHHNKIEI